MKRIALAAAIIATVLLVLPATGLSDPCGMVPPIYTGRGRPIERVGLQQTYVFYRNGVETIAIKPGFRGKVDEFGMLIPFPTPPALRKLPDNFFTHVTNAAEPPEIVVWARPPRYDLDDAVKGAAAPASPRRLQLGESQVRVLKREAVGMYEVAVLAAGSARALKRWMDSHRYRYPKGMDVPVGDYVKLGWCFVAVRTRVGAKAPVNPRPGQRRAKATLPPGGFNGAVQAMGFRFRSKQLVVPMRLSAFNGGRMRNVVYLLTDGPKRIDRIPEKYVMRQISGAELYRNITKPLPVRVIGGDPKIMTASQRRSMKRRRNPEPFMKYAAQLFGGDALAVKSGRLSHPFEEQEKALLNISEALSLRGPQIDAALEKLNEKRRKRDLKRSLRGIQQMTLTIVDGDFSRDVVANHNLTFSTYRMPASQNNIKHYDPKRHRPGRVRKDGKRFRGRVRFSKNTPNTETNLGLGAAGVGLLLALALVARRNSR